MSSARVTKKTRSMTPEGQHLRIALGFTFMPCRERERGRKKKGRPRQRGTEKETDIEGGEVEEEEEGRRKR